MKEVLKSIVKQARNMGQLSLIDWNMKPLPQLERESKRIKCVEVFSKVKLLS